MSDVALLNPPRTAEACQKMLAIVQGALDDAEHTLTHSVLTERDYLLHMGRAQALRSAYEEMSKTYRRVFET